MDPSAKNLNTRRTEWKPETAEAARNRIPEVIDLARSRTIEQEVLDLLDEPPT